MSEQKRIAEELDQRVAERTRELAEANDALKQELVVERQRTTKSSGMGIGLFVSRSIIEKDGGRLWGEPNEGPGATFAFSIRRDPERMTDAARVMRTS